MWAGWTRINLAQGHDILTFLWPICSLCPGAKYFPIWPVPTWLLRILSFDKLFLSSFFLLFAFQEAMYRALQLFMVSWSLPPLFFCLKCLIFYNVFHWIYIQGFTGHRITDYNNNRTEWNSIRSVILSVINTIRWLQSGSPVC